jgi:hypothetical protein
LYRDSSSIRSSIYIITCGVVTLFLDILVVVDEFIAGSPPILFLFGEELIVDQLPFQEAEAKPLVELDQMVPQVGQGAGATLVVLEVHHQLSDGVLKVAHHLSYVCLGEDAGLLRP